MSLCMGESDQIQFGDALGTGDLYMECTSNVLSIDVVVPGTGSVAIGNDADDVPLVWYGETTGAEVTFTSDDVQIDGISLCMGESDQIQFGDALGTGDITLSCASNLLTVGQVAAGTGSVAFGVDGAGLDITIYGDTASQKVTWTTATDTWGFGADAEGVDAKFFADTTGDYMLWDEDSANEALTFVGANIKLDSDSGIINAAVAVTDAASYSILASNTGKTLVVGDLTQNTALVLPVEAAGLYYRIIYAAAAADAHDHTINSEADANYFIGGVAFIDLDAGFAADELSTVYSNGSSNSKLTINNAGAGTVVELYCDGTHWYVSGTIISDTVPAFANQ